MTKQNIKKHKYEINDKNYFPPGIFILLKNMAVDQSLLQLISDVNITMGSKCGKPILPDPLQLYGGHMLPFPDTINDLQLEIIHPTKSKASKIKENDKT